MQSSLSPRPPSHSALALPAVPHPHLNTHLNPMTLKRSKTNQRKSHRAPPTTTTLNDHSPHHKHSNPSSHPTSITPAHYSTQKAQSHAHTQSRAIHNHTRFHTYHSWSSPPKQKQRGMSVVGQKLYQRELQLEDAKKRCDELSGTLRTIGCRNSKKLEESLGRRQQLLKLKKRLQAVNIGKVLTVLQRLHTE